MLTRSGEYDATILKGESELALSKAAVPWKFATVRPAWRISATEDEILGSKHANGKTNPAISFKPITFALRFAQVPPTP